MAKQWKCARCGTKNDEGTLTCTNCRMIRGAVVVPGTFNAAPAPDAGRDSQPDVAPSAAEPGPSPAWPTTTDAAPAGSTPGQPDPAQWNLGASQPAFAEVSGPIAFLRRIPLGVLLFVGFLAVGAVGSFIANADRSSSGEITREGDMMATDLRVGDCFDLKDVDSEEITDVTAKPCLSPHEYELFFTGSMVEGPYPGDAAFDVYFEANCVGAFATYVGKAYADSELDIFWLTPLEGAWESGDRSIQCAAYDPANPELIGSLKGVSR
jgi:hypothetical protein